MGNLSLILKERRKALGLTLSQIADQMGVTEATVQRWESGNIRSVRPDKLKKLAEILKVSPAALLDIEDPGLMEVLAVGTGNKVLMDYFEWQRTAGADGGFFTFPQDEQRLLDLYRALNEEGQEKLVDYADDLVTSGKYIKSNPAGMVHEK